MRSRVAVQALLAGRSHDYLRPARPLLRSLELTHHFDVEVITDQGALDSKRSRGILAASDEPRGAGACRVGGPPRGWDRGGAPRHGGRGGPRGRRGGGRGG